MSLRNPDGFHSRSALCAIRYEDLQNETERQAVKLYKELVEEIEEAQIMGQTCSQSITALSKKEKKEEFDQFKIEMLRKQAQNYGEKESYADRLLIDLESTPVVSDIIKRERFRFYGKANGTFGRPTAIYICQQSDHDRFRRITQICQDRKKISCGPRRTIRNGNTIEKAIALALQDLNLDFDQVDIRIIEVGEKGFLGLTTKQAKVEVTEKVKIGDCGF